MKKNISIFLLGIFLLGGCATHSYTDGPPSIGAIYSKYAQIGYEGDLRPIGDIGIVTTDGIVKVRQLNGRPMESFRLFKAASLFPGGRYQLHLLPGAYELALAFRFDNGSGSISWSTSDLTKSIIVTKGQVLHLSWIGRGRSSWGVQEFDGSSALATITDDFEKLTKKKPE
jgi:hypothetical protein